MAKYLRIGDSGKDVHLLCIYYWRGADISVQDNSSNTAPHCTVLEGGGAAGGIGDKYQEETLL